MAGPLLAELTTLHRLLVLAGSDDHVPFLQATLRLYGAYEQLDPRREAALQQEAEVLGQRPNRSARA